MTGPSISMAGLRSFYAGRRVLVTGHTGFKGAWLVLWLQRLGAQVTGFALDPPTDPSIFAQGKLAERMQSIRGDVRDLASVEACFREARPEVVFHLAAQSLVRPSYADPIGTFATNVMGTAHVLDAVRRSRDVVATVVVTSDKCYENREWIWPYRESDPMGGYDPYSASKGCAELVTSSFSRSFFSGKGIASGRAGNVIGGGDWSLDRLVPDAMRAFAEARPVRLRNPASLRPWQHVLEPLLGYLGLGARLGAEPERFAGGWNFGPHEDDVRPVSDVVNLLAAAWGEGARAEVEGGEHPHEAKILRLDATKARTELGWRPRLALRDAATWTAAWYRDVGRGAGVVDRTLQDIQRYEEHER